MVIFLRYENRDNLFGTKKHIQFFMNVKIWRQIHLLELIPSLYYAYLGKARIV